MIEINIGAVVESQGHEVGRVACIVLDSEAFEATHLVVKQGRPLQTRLLLMPVNWVASSERDRVRIHQTEDDLNALPNFEAQHYVRLDQFDQERLEHPRSKIRPMDWISYFVPALASTFGDSVPTPGVLVTEQMLSPSECAVRRGLAVESNDGHRLGEIQEVLLSAPDWRLSGVIIGRGFVLKHPMRVPADWVAKIERERIVLNRSKQQVEAWEKEQARQ